MCEILMMADTHGNINYRQGPSVQLTKKGITKTYIYIGIKLFWGNFRKTGNTSLLTGNRKSPCPVTRLFRYLIVIKYNIPEKSR
jgi:hypothetical protein